MAPRGYEIGHLDRLSMMTDHALHETNVCRRVPDAGEVDGLRCRDCAAGLTRGTRADYRRGASDGAAGCRRTSEYQRKRRYDCCAPCAHRASVTSLMHASTALTIS
jgi:hypothetical protein